jgi:hypothetical protein
MRVLVKEHGGTVFELTECPFQGLGGVCRHFGRAQDNRGCGYPVTQDGPPETCPLRRTPTLVMVSTDDAAEYPVV